MIKIGGDKQLLNDPSVSVIIPVYNGEKYLRRAIESIINQTYTGEYEVLLLDDGSTDGTAAICKEYVEKYPSFVRYHYHDNVGLGRSRERAATLAQGDYLCWVDSDDYVSPDLLKITMQKIKETNADICVFSWQAVQKNGRIINIFMNERQSLSDWKKLTITGNITSVCTYICKKELWNNEQMPWQVWRNGEDSYITPILFKKAKNIVSVPDILYYYFVQNTSSITHTYSGIGLLGIGYCYYLKFKISLENYPEIVDHVGKYALRMLTRAYAVGACLKDLDEEKRELLRTWILYVADHLKNQSFRNRYRVFFIRHRWDHVMAFVGKLSLDKKKRQNKKLQKM